MGKHGVAALVSRSNPTGGHKGRNGKALVGQVALGGMREGHTVEIVLSFGTAFEQELALLGYDDHFGRAAITTGKRFYPKDYANVVVTENPNKLLGTEMRAASGHGSIFK
jgi:hypothetical protein